MAEGDLFEVPILTVEPRWRATAAAPLLMYAALRWIAARGGGRVVASRAIGTTTGRPEIEHGQQRSAPRWVAGPAPGLGQRCSLCPRVPERTGEVRLGDAPRPSPRLLAALCAQWPIRAELDSQAHTATVAHTRRRQELSLIHRDSRTSRAADRRRSRLRTTAAGPRGRRRRQSVRPGRRPRSHRTGHRDRYVRPLHGGCAVAGRSRERGARFRLTGSSAGTHAPHRRRGRLGVDGRDACEYAIELGEPVLPVVVDPGVDNGAHRGQAGARLGPSPGTPAPAHAREDGAEAFQRGIEAIVCCVMKELRVT